MDAWVAAGGAEQDLDAWTCDSREPPQRHRRIDHCLLGTEMAHRVRR